MFNYSLNVLKIGDAFVYRYYSVVGIDTNSSQVLSVSLLHNLEYHLNTIFMLGFMIKGILFRFCFRSK